MAAWRGCLHRALTRPLPVQSVFKTIDVNGKIDVPLVFEDNTSSMATDFNKLADVFDPFTESEMFSDLQVRFALSGVRVCVAVCGCV